ncbi:MAG: sugar transferase [Nevskia sp.]|nr:sugar transferase [Nevskia sp.]
MSSNAEPRIAAKTVHARSGHPAVLSTFTSVRVHVPHVPRREHSPSVDSGKKSQPLRALAERGLDIIFALGLAAVFSPVILTSAVALSLSGGAIIFKQTRLGRGGREFRVYKFRTMVPNAAEVLQQLLDRDPVVREEWERDFKIRNDPRVTSIGRFLRKTSLDELPQLWNILKGDMSMVGPRPIEPFEIVKYGRFAKHYYALRPGLTGLWQVSGRSDTTYQRRVALDAFYAKNRSLSLNLGIILKTVRVVLKGSGAH